MLVFIASGRSCLLTPWLATVAVSPSFAAISLSEALLWDEEQLLEREEHFDNGEEGREDFGGAVLVREVEVIVLELEFMEAVVDTESEEIAEVRAGFVSGKVNRLEVAGPADIGLMS